MRRVCWAVLVAGLSTLCAAAQVTARLQNGQRVTVKGKLLMQSAGRLQFAALLTSQQYTAVVEKHDAAAAYTLGLAGYQRYDLLYAHRDQPVTVTGTVMTNDASPYYLHKLSLAADSIRLSDGTELIGKPRTRAPLAVDVGNYRASVVLAADPTRPWQYSAHGQPDTERRFLSCSSNGGGDVVNCSCGAGFRAIRGESSAAGTQARILADPHTAQFGPVDSGLRVELSVTCSR